MFQTARRRAVFSFWGTKPLKASRDFGYVPVGILFQSLVGGYWSLPVNTRVIVWVGVVLACMLGVMPGRVMAKSTDSPETALADARALYEQAMAKLRASIEDELQKAANEASHSKDPLPAVKKVSALRSAYVQKGELPDLRGKSDWQAQNQRAREAMKKAYAQAIIAFGNAGMAELEKAVNAESDAFGKHADLVPWQDGVVIAGSGATNSLLPTDGTKDAGADLGSGYRVEVRGKRTSATGELMMVLPVGEGRRVELPCVVGANGEVWALVTVMDRVPLADLGVTRPADAAKVSSSNGKKVGVRAVSGEFGGLVVRMKPVVIETQDDVADPKPAPEAAKPAREEPAKAPAAEKEGRARAGKGKGKGGVWRGTWQTKIPKPGAAVEMTYRVTSHTETEGILVADVPGTAAIELRFDVKGTTWSLRSARAVGNRGGNYHDASGKLTIVKRGDQNWLTGSLKWQVDVRKVTNQPHEVAVEVQME